MALKFVKVKRKVLGGKDAGKEKYYAMARTGGVTDLNKVCRIIEARSSLSSADIKSVFDNLSWVVDMELKSGNVVQLGELGNFRLSVRSEGAETMKDLDATKVRGAKIIFSPGAVLRETRTHTVFEPFMTKDEECDKEHVL